ncbi:MAG TPA: hypothetical protein PLU24_06085, partial [Candidatus Omnitrophota bacterium]|nr:hypothetical protein [Candidatus Omnitrophota bacterium]
MTVVHSLIENADPEKGYFFQACGSGRSGASLFLTDLPWDSEYFGLKMAKIEEIRVSEKMKSNGLLPFVFEFAKDRGIRHISAKIDSDNFPAIHSLEEAGFVFMGCYLVYSADLRKINVPEFKGFCKVRTLREKDIPAVMRIAKEFGPSASRFSLDRNLPFSRSSRFYLEWTRNACERKFADEVLIAERNQKVIGFASYKLNEELEKNSGMRCMHSG